MSVSWTEEQKKVIDLRDRSMLVSAAAGSGKTAVLVERIISMVTDPEHPLDIDRLLVVTFTNAAASEMRERVGKAIEQALEADPYDTHLQRQLTLVHNAKITTIDSFCVDVIKNHFHKIDLEPGFRIADEGELKLLREDVCDQMLEEFYASKDPEFLKFADSYSGAKSDEQIRTMVLGLYDYSVSYPWPKEWLSGCVKQYRASDETGLEEKPWIIDFLKYLGVRVDDLIRRHRELYALTEEPDGPYMYAASIQDDLRQLENLRTSGNLVQWQENISHIKFKMIGNARKYEGSELKKQAVIDGRDQMKKQISQMQNNYFSVSMDEQAKLLEKTAGMVEMLVKLVFAFSEKFSEEKAKKNILDFSDVEHNALNVLVDPKTKELTETAGEYQEQFAEVMIDEYQDSNYVQETLLTAVSGLASGRENLFMVGDVKQSIYRFRLARPELFMEKYHTFSLEDGKKQRIDLHKNFRSRNEVVDVVNEIFYHIMGKDLGNVEYDREAALYAGASFPEYEDASCCQPEFILVPAETSGEDKKLTEARVVAQRIRKLVRDQEILGIQYKDIVILLRSLSGWAESFQKVFEQEGIPLIVASQTGYFLATEVQTVLSLLRVIDNPRQDIPLAAVLKSPVGGFTSEELALIKAAFPDRAFYQCVFDFAKIKNDGSAGREDVVSGMESDINASGKSMVSGMESGSLNKQDELQKKLSGFLDKIRDFRSRVPYTPIHQLLQEILDETGYRRYVTALPGGEQRRANLDMLLEKAAAYEKTSYHGLFHFVRYIDKLMKYDVDYGEAEIISEQENAVRLMSIHKSKGLEFPVVFVSGMGKQFNQQDSRSNMIFHPEYGIGLKWFDSEKRTKSDTLIRQVFALEAKKENLGEELRILYVALTRAKEKLILTGSGDLPEEGKYLPLDSEEKLDFSTRFDAKCYWDWVIPALGGASGRYPMQVWDLDVRVAGELDRQMTLSRTKRNILEALEQKEPSVYDEIDRQLNWTYPYAGKSLKKQKVSVSELKHRAMEEAAEVLEETEEHTLFPNEVPVPYLPKFIEASEENAGALYGTAVHRFLECFDYSSLPELSSWEEGKAFLKKQADALVEKGRMTKEDAQRLNLYQLYQFLKTDTAWRMKKSASFGLLAKEKPFVMSVPARDVWEDADAESTVLVQGIIDVFWEEDGGIVLLDYKTDRVNAPEELIRRYQKQLSLYAEALERNFPDKVVKEILIYSFCLETCVVL